MEFYSIGNARSSDQNCQATRAFHSFLEERLTSQVNSIIGQTTTSYSPLNDSSQFKSIVGDHVILKKGVDVTISQKLTQCW